MSRSIHKFLSLFWHDIEVKASKAFHCKSLYFTIATVGFLSLECRIAGYQLIHVNAREAAKLLFRLMKIATMCVWIESAG
jgi:bacteriorhodopsin